MTPFEIVEAAIDRAVKDMADAIACNIYSDPDSFVGPKPQWRTWQAHPNEWELDGGGPGQYWLPKFGTRSWIQQKLRNRE